MTYEEMSDFEINMLVAIAEGLIVNDLQSASLKSKSSSVLVKNSISQFEFNPCNNPRDWLPIILKGEISLLFGWGDCEVSFDYLSPCGDFGMSEALTHAINVDKDKVMRTAMICYLIMKDMEDA